MTGRTHIAHFNWATLRKPVGHPRVAPFVEAVPKVNALARRSPGYVWNCGEEAQNARAAGWLMFVEDDRVIASFSVWKTPEALKDYVYKTVHGAFFRRGDEWFEPDALRGYALWWVPEGHRPTIAEARERVETLLADGPSEQVFTFAEVAAAD